MSLHCRLVPVLYREHENGLFAVWNTPPRIHGTCIRHLVQAIVSITTSTMTITYIPPPLPPLSPSKLKNTIQTISFFGIEYVTSNDRQNETPAWIQTPSSGGWSGKSCGKSTDPVRIKPPYSKTFHKRPLKMLRRYNKDIMLHDLCSIFRSIICQVVAYGRLKTKGSFKFLALKVVSVAYKRWSLTRGSK